MNETKQKIVDEVIEYLKKDFTSGDYTVLDELLGFVPINNLIQSLPEERWKELAISWWNDLEWKTQLEFVGKYLSEARMPSSLAGSEIETIWGFEVK